MTTLSISKLKAEFATVIDRVENGEEVIVTRRGKPIAKLTPIRSRKMGLLKGKITISDDFDDPIPELEALFYGDDPTLSSCEQ